MLEAVGDSPQQLRTGAESMLHFSNFSESYMQSGDNNEEKASHNMELDKPSLPDSKGYTGSRDIPDNRCIYGPHIRWARILRHPDGVTEWAEQVEEGRVNFLLFWDYIANYGAYDKGGSQLVHWLSYRQEEY